MEEMRRRGGISKQLSDDLEEKKIYGNLKAKELDRSVWRSRFRKDVTRQTTYWWLRDEDHFLFTSL